MRLEKDVKCNLLFSPDEWRTHQQISQLFSRLAAAQKQVDEEDIVAEKIETALATLRNKVMEQVAAPQHPIVIGERNICQLVHEAKLGSLKIVELQSICETLDAEPIGSFKRKKSYVTPIETFIKTCQCFSD